MTPIRFQALLASSLAILAGCQPPSPAASQESTGASGSVNPTIAADYQEFSAKVKSNPAEAKAALERARAADTENGYTLYLLATIPADAEDLKGALDLIQEGNTKKHTTIYTSAPPPADVRLSLANMFPLYTALRKAGSLGDQELAFLQASQVMGERIARSSPGGAIEFLTGGRILATAAEEEHKYWENKKDAAKAKAAKDRADRILKWYRSSGDSLAAAMREASGGTPATEAGYKEKLYKVEAELSKKILEQMPK